MESYDKLIKRIRKSSNVFVMAHKNIDLDGLGASLAINELCNFLKKKCYIIIEDMKFDGSVKRGLDYIEENYKCNIGKIGEFKDKIDNSLLVLVDTYSDKRSQSPKLCTMIKNILYVDHHLFGDPLNDDFWINSKVSSTCEMLTEIFSKKKIKINKYAATIMLSGIDVDTNNYSIKTTYKTHEAVAFLLKKNADLNVAINFTRTKIEEYIKIQKIVFKTEFYKKKYAIVIGGKDEIYERKSLAVISDTLLMFNNVDASFAIGFIDKGLIGVSARSMEKDVEKIMTKFGGGGHKNNAACQIEGKDLEKIKKQIKEELI